MEIAGATEVEKTYLIIKSITQSALKAGITQEAYADYINYLNREKITEEVLEK